MQRSTSRFVAVTAAAGLVLTTGCTVTVDDRKLVGPADIPLIEFLAGHQISLPHICYDATLGALQTCDTCWVVADGQLQRGCSLKARDGLRIGLNDEQAEQARREGADRIVARHELYCSVCENNNGDCQVHNVVREMEIPYQRYPYRQKPYEVDDSHPFYRYDADQCILCGRCVEACQNIQVTETLSIDWQSDDPRVLWDGGEVANESSCVSCGHCVTVCPCNALMEKTMLGEAGPLTAMPASLKRPAIDLIKAVEPTNNAKYIVFKTFYRPTEALGQLQIWYSWPYTEVLTTKEAMNNLALLCTGIYGKPLPQQPESGRAHV